MSKIIISRSKERVNMARDYVIFINGKERMHISYGKRKSLKLKPGKYTIEARLDDEYSSTPMRIVLGSNEVKRFRLKSFRYNTLILPGLAVIIPLFYFLHSEYGISFWLCLLPASPLLGMAIYYHFVRRDRYLRWVPLRKVNGAMVKETATSR